MPWSNSVRTFDIREFHDAVLKNGAVPMQVLDEVVDAYIKAKHDGSPEQGLCTGKVLANRR